jgi:phage recombination protein Bet
MTAETIKGAVAERKSTPAPAPAPDAALALRGGETWWSPRQLAALKGMGIKHASPEELLVFLHYCQKTALDPFSKQIYLLERRSKNQQTGEWEYQQTIVIGIDGYRVVAQRAAKREGVHLSYEDTVWFDENMAHYEIWLASTPPAGAKVTVMKHMDDGTKLPYPGVARFTSYAAYARGHQGDAAYLQSQWAVMEDHMIEKCAEAFGLRRAFPNDLGGTYSEEEVMQQQEPLGNPPKMEPYARDAESDDEGVIPGGVDTDTGERTDPAASDSRPSGGTPEPEHDKPKLKPAGVRERQRVNARLHATFSEHGMGTQADADARRGVICMLLNLPAPVPAAQLDDKQLSAALTALEGVVKAEQDNPQTEGGTNVAAVLRELAAAGMAKS